jgi:hypothetical protein
MHQPQSSQKVLRQNPFTTYRDPSTGRWLVVQAIQDDSTQPMSVHDGSEDGCRLARIQPMSHSVR